MRHRFYAINFRCPECGEDDPMMLANSPGLPFKEDTWYFVKKKEGENIAQAKPNGVTKCEKCGKSYYYKLEMIPAVRIFKMTDTSQEDLTYVELEVPPKD